MYGLGLLVILSGLLENGSPLGIIDKALEGEIKFPAENAPDSLKPGSCLTVKLEDTSLQNANSTVVLRLFLMGIEKAYRKGRALKYKLDFPREKGLDDKASYAVSAVVNNGWCPEGGSKEWIRKDDFLTITNTPVDITKCLGSSCKVDDMNLTKNS